MKREGVVVVVILDSKVMNRTTAVVDVSEEGVAGAGAVAVTGTGTGMGAGDAGKAGGPRR